MINDYLLFVWSIKGFEDMSFGSCSPFYVEISLLNLAGNDFSTCNELR